MRAPFRCPPWTLVTLAALAAVLPTAGCKSKCEKLYAKVRKCYRAKGLEKDKFITLCKEDAETKATVSCVGKSSCKKFKSCVRKARKKARLATLGREFNAKAEKKKFEDLLLDCSIHRQDLKPALLQLCDDAWVQYAKQGQLKQVMRTCDYRKEKLSEVGKRTCAAVQKRYFDALMKRAAVLRDKTPEASAFEICYPLKRVGKGLSKVFEQEARDRCAEIKVARSLRRIQKKVAEALRAKRPSVPWVCRSSTFGELAKVQTAFAKAARQKVVEGCYGQLGVRQLQQAIADKRCGANEKVLLEALKKHAIKLAALDPLLLGLQPLCK